MLLGMGIVFGFLILLVFVLKLMSWVATLVGTEEAVATPATAPAPVADDGKLIAVISAAIARYRADRSR
jgi:oxaloacetate decarboxylase gamma subunit